MPLPLPSLSPPPLPTPMKDPVQNAVVNFPNGPLWISIVNNMLRG